MVQTVLIYSMGEVIGDGLIKLPFIAGLRVGVKNGGCAGQEYVFEYAKEKGPIDEVAEDKGVTILI